jgi:hypothetical protein
MNQEELNKKHKRDAQSGYQILLLRSVIVVIIAVIITVMFFLPPHWWQIALGTIAFVIGSAGSILTDKWKNHKLLKWGRIIFLPIILAAGGLFTTYGWNTRNNYLRDRALLISVGCEWRINKTYIHVQSEHLKEYLAKGGHLSTPISALPTTQEARQALTQITSLRNDKPLIHALTVYVMAVDRLVPLCEHTDRLCSQPIATLEMKRTFVKTNLGNGKNSAFQYFIEAHKQLENTLNYSYPWLLTEAESRVGKDFLDAVDHTQLIIIADPNNSG